MKGLNEKLGNTAMTTTQSQSHIPMEILKKGLSIGKTVLAIIKCHWIDVQWKVFDGGLSTSIVEGLNKNKNALHGYSNFPNSTKVMGIFPIKKGKGMTLLKYLI